MCVFGAECRLSFLPSFVLLFFLPFFLSRCLYDSLCSPPCVPTIPGPMVWYQKFEYAVGHWLQKTAEHVFGSVLCSPGCFSLFRGSALMDDNVLKRYTTTATRAAEYVQYDQGWHKHMHVQRPFLPPLVLSLTVHVHIKHLFFGLFCACILV